MTIEDQEIKQIEAKPEVEAGSTDTSDIPRPTSASLEQQSEKDPEAAVTTDNVETRPESTSADAPEVADNGTAIDARPSSAAQKDQDSIEYDK